MKYINAYSNNVMPQVSSHTVATLNLTKLIFNKSQFNLFVTKIERFNQGGNITLQGNSVNIYTKKRQKRL